MKLLPIIASLSLIWFISCDKSIVTVDSCGDQILDPGEECDSGIGALTCESLGYYNPEGQLRCLSNCHLDAAECGGRCGDNQVDADDGERCDGIQLEGQSCQSLGFGGGVLVCGDDCQFDIHGCANACGNGVVEGSEVCDDGNQRDDDGCSRSCVPENGWDCDDQEPTHCVSSCGDQVAVADEACDGADTRGVTCLSLGYHGGVLVCSAGCELDETPCQPFGRCGDGVLQSEHEDCEGSDVGGQTCLSLHLYPGELTCGQDCIFDTSRCVGWCGDGVIEPAETCDGANLDGATCVTQGFVSGVLTCATNCDSFVTTACTHCGNGYINTGETCDGGNLNGATCATQGFTLGTLACRADCLSFDTSGCYSCGDGIIGGPESCDGANVGGQTCAVVGCRPGTLLCNADCLGLNTSGCYHDQDEDADGLDDNCDNCPSIFNGSQTNADADGVGDACESGLPGQNLIAIAFFEAFAVVAPGWSVVLGTWTPGVDSITGSHLQGGNYIYNSVTTGTTFSVETIFQYNTIPPSEANKWTAVLFGVAYSGTTFSSGWECTYDRSNGQLGLYRYMGGWSSMAGMAIPNVAPATLSVKRRIRANVMSGQIQCTYNDENGATATLSYTNASAISGKTGIRVYNDTVQFNSFVLYQ